MSNIQTLLNLSSSPLAHYRVEDVTEETGSQVHTWSDQSGRANHLVTTSTSTYDRAIAPIVSNSPRVEQPTVKTHNKVDRVMRFTNNKMGCVLNSPITSHNMECYLVCTNLSWAVGHLIGLQNNSAGRGYSFGRTNNSGSVFSIYDGYAGADIPGVRFETSLYRFTMTDTTMEAQDMLTGETRSIDRTTILDIVLNPLEQLTVGSGIWSGNEAFYQSAEVEFVEIVMFDSVLNSDSQDRLKQHLIDKYDLLYNDLVPDSGNCVYMNGSHDATITVKENWDVAPSISSQQSLTSHVGNTNLHTAVMWEMWFKPEYTPPGVDDPRKQLLFSFGNTSSHYMYLDVDRYMSSVTELFVRNNHYWWINGVGSTRLYGRWNRLCWLHDSQSHDHRVIVNGQTIHQSTHSYNRYSNLDAFEENAVIGYHPSFSDALYTGFRGKVLGMRKIRDTYDNLINSAETYTRWEDLPASTSSAVIEPDKLELQPVYKHMNNITKKPLLVSGRYKPQPLSIYTAFDLSRGFNAWKPRFTHVEELTHFRIQQSNGRFKDMSAFVNVLGPNMVFDGNRILTLNSGRVETLSHLRGSLFNKRSRWHIFDMNRNRLTDLDGIQDLKQVQYLRLSYNQISDISALTELEEGALTSLYELDLTYNKIESLPTGAFSKLDSSAKYIKLDGNPLTTLNNISTASNLQVISVNTDLFTGDESISDLSNCLNLRGLIMYGPNITTLPDLSSTDLQSLTIYNNPDLVDVSTTSNVIKDSNVLDYSSAVSTTDSLYWNYSIYNCPNVDWDLIEAKAASGDRISVSGRLYLYSNPNLKNLTVFQNSYQDDTYSYKTRHDLARFDVRNTAVEDTASSLGIMKNFRYCAGIYLQNCPNVHSLHQHAMPSDPPFDRDYYYNNWFGYYTYLDSSSISDLSFLLNPQAAGIYALQLYSCPNITYESFAAIKDQLINLKKTTNMRLWVIYITGTGLETKFISGESGPVCTDGVLNPEAQLKSDLWDAGIRLVGNSWRYTNDPYRLGSSSQRPQCE